MLRLISHTLQDLEALALLAGFTGTSILGEMHAFRARDPRTDDIGEGMSPVQVRQCDTYVQTSLTLSFSNTHTYVLSRASEQR